MSVTASSTLIEKSRAYALAMVKVRTSNSKRSHLTKMATPTKMAGLQIKNRNSAKMVLANNNKSQINPILVLPSLVAPVSNEPPQTRSDPTHFSFTSGRVTISTIGHFSLSPGLAKIPTCQFGYQAG
jgi:hypothetical protein